MEPDDSLRMGDEHRDTIPKKESNEFIKFSVENLVLNPSESKDLSDGESDLPACDDFITFSNLLFDADDDFSSSDNESFSDEDFSKEIYSNPLFDEEIISIKIYPHHLKAKSDLMESLLNQDSSIISSSKIDTLLDEFTGKLILLKSIPPGIDEADCDPEEEIRLIEKLFNDSLLLPENESFHFDIPTSPRHPTKPPDDDKIEPNLGILTVKVEKSAHLLSHQGLKAFQLPSESPMMIYGGNIPILDVPFFHFYPP
nr:hypothetical protein [Tanacetum cinerariifolium]